MDYATTYDEGLVHSLSRRPSMSRGISAPAAYSYGGYMEPGLQASIICFYSD